MGWLIVCDYFCIMVIVFIVVGNNFELVIVVVIVVYGLVFLVVFVVVIGLLVEVLVLILLVNVVLWFGGCWFFDDVMLKEVCV